MNRHDPKACRKRWACAAIALATCVRLAAGAGGDLEAQSSAPPLPRFEVVSVKRNSGGGVTSMMGIQPGGRFTVRNLAVRQVILPAFGILPFQQTRVGAKGSWAALDALNEAQA